MNVDENQRTHLSSKTMKSFTRTYQSNGLLLLTFLYILLYFFYKFVITSYKVMKEILISFEIARSLIIDL